MQESILNGAKIFRKKIFIHERYNKPNSTIIEDTKLVIIGNSGNEKLMNLQQKLNIFTDDV
jgi:hypothetical protein